jgi:hypothetical protein
MLITLKTKTPQIVRSDTQETAIVYFQLEEIIDKGSHYLALFRYFYKVEDQEIDLTYKTRRKEITAEQANAIAASVENLTSGTSKRERDTIEATAGAKAILQEDKAKNWQLNAADWEVTE